MRLIASDIKPQNFLIDSSARIILTDFGVAAPLLLSASGDHRARRVDPEYSAVPTGTPDYIAPDVLEAGEAALAAIWSGSDDHEEERLADHGYTASVDLWSLGATIYEMATGEAPFVAPTISETYKRIMKCDLQLDRLGADWQCADLRDLIAG